MRKISNIADWNKLIEDFDSYAIGDEVFWVQREGESAELGWRIAICHLYTGMKRDGIGCYDADDPSDDPETKTPQEYYDNIADKIGTPFCVSPVLNCNWLSQEDESAEENESKRDVCDVCVVNSFKKFRRLAKYGFNGEFVLSNSQFAKLCGWIYEIVYANKNDNVVKRFGETIDRIRIAVELLLEAERIEWFNGEDDVKVFFPEFYDEEEDVERQTVVALRNVDDYLEKIKVFSQFEPF